MYVKKGNDNRIFWGLRYQCVEYVTREPGLIVTHVKTMLQEE